MTYSNLTIGKITFQNIEHSISHYIETSKLIITTCTNKRRKVPPALIPISYMSVFFTFNFIPKEIHWGRYKKCVVEW